MAKPFIHSTILPFGLSEDGKFFRFSLCLDLKPASDFTTEDLTSVGGTIDLFRSGDFFDMLNGDNGHLLIDGKRKLPLRIFPASQVFSKERSVTLWKQLFPENRVVTFERSTDEIIVPDKVRTFLGRNPEDLKANLFAEKASQNFQTLERFDIDTIFTGDDYKALSEEIESVKSTLDAIGSFSLKTNAQQVQAAVVKRMGPTEQRNPAIFGFNLDTVYDQFAMISADLLLQRFFGLTFEFDIPVGELQTVTNFKARFETDFSNDHFSWSHIVTPMEVLAVDTKKVIVVRSTKAEALNAYTTNYDIGSKLRSLDGINEKIADYVQRLKAAKLESERINIRRQILKVDTAALTRGINIYDNSVVQELLKRSAIKLKATDETTVDAHDVARGERYGVLIDNAVISLGARSVEVLLKGKADYEEFALPEAYSVQQFSANSDTGMHIIDETTGEHQLVVDQALMTWSGENIGFPSVFANPEQDDQDENSSIDGSLSASAHAASEGLRSIFGEEYVPEKVKHTKPKSTEPLMKFRYRLMRATNPKLLFGRKYKGVFVTEYKNGWAIPFNDVNVSSDGVSTLGLNSILKFSKIPGVVGVFEHTFKRNESVKPVKLFLTERLIQEKAPNSTEKELVATKGRDGESLHHLVIRNYSSKDDDKVYKTKQRSVRHVLPGDISFEHAWWHNVIFSVQDRSESYKWYMKYHYPAIEGSVVHKLVNGQWQEQPGQTYSLEEAIKGSTRMREFYPDECTINYLPDPLSKGFRLQFFRDKERLISASDFAEYEDAEFYFTGDYPSIKAWKIIIEDFRKKHVKRVVVNVRKQEICIRLDKGQELFISARTILHENYERDLETFGNYNEFTRLGNNEIITPPMEFTAVHATQRALVRPKFITVIGNEKKAIGNPLTSLRSSVEFEHLGVYETNAGLIRYLEHTLPTGAIEVYSKWEEYKDDPQHLPYDDRWTPDLSVNKVNLEALAAEEGESEAALETTIGISDLLAMEASIIQVGSDRNAAKNFATALTFAINAQDTKYIEKWCWLVNKSKFTSYYPAHWGTADTNDDRKESNNTFNRISSKPFLIKILNNKKPVRPGLTDSNIRLVAVTEDYQSEKSVTRKMSMRRLRFYFKRGRLTSGKGERIGFLVNEPFSPYNDLLVDRRLVSVCGRDVTTDGPQPFDGLYRNTDVLLQKSNFVINDPYGLTDESQKATQDIERFAPKYVEELGIMTFLPKFDRDRNLWYLDVELDLNDIDGRESHSLFVQFSLVHYQENSVNYNSEGQANLELDTRISNVYKTGFVYVLGSRTIIVHRGTDSVSVLLSADHTSVVTSSEASYRTKFYAAIERRAPRAVAWNPVAAREGNGEAFAEIKPNDRTVIEYVGKKPGDYRLVVLETESWDQQENKTLRSLLANSSNRVVLVSVFSNFK